MKTCNHHKKLEGDIPTWLWFAFYPAGQGKRTEEKESLMRNVKNSLVKFLESHDISNPIVTEPNNYDSNSICDKCLEIKNKC